jgi:hypothetical protein
VFVKDSRLLSVYVKDLHLLRKILNGCVVDEIYSAGGFLYCQSKEAIVSYCGIQPGIIRKEKTTELVFDGVVLVRVPTHIPETPTPLSSWFKRGVRYSNELNYAVLSQVAEIATYTNRVPLTRSNILVDIFIEFADLTRAANQNIKTRWVSEVKQHLNQLE